MARDRDRAFFGHPIGLANLFFTEMWERFSYYGMRPLLVSFLTAKVLEEGGRGMSAVSAGSIYAVFGSAVYFLALPGGWIADRFLGQRKGVILGGIGIAGGNAMLAIPDSGKLFYLGLTLIALGTGFLKPNVSSLVGQLYKPGDRRRDAGYTIYYMGINIGATLAPFACGYLAQTDSFRGWVASHGINPNYVWNFAFGAAAVGMVLGLIQFISLKHLLGDAGAHPTIPTDPKRAQRDRYVLGGIVGALVAIGVAIVVAEPSEGVIANVQGVGLIVGAIIMFFAMYSMARDDKERRGILAMIPMFLGAVAFFAIFEQAPSTLNIYAEKLTEPKFLGFFEPAYYQSINAIFIIVFAPLFAWIWLRLGKANKEPTSVNKFAIGMVLLAFAFVAMLPTLGATETSRVSGWFLTVLYLFNTFAELCISPVGLSSMSKLAPQRLAGMVMGMWFFGTGIGIWLAGRATVITAKFSYDTLFITLIIVSLVVAGALFLIAPKIKRMMGEDGEDQPASELPEARMIEKDT